MQDYREKGAGKKAEETESEKDVDKRPGGKENDL